MIIDIKIYNYPPISEARREVANLNEIKTCIALYVVSKNVPVYLLQTLTPIKILDIKITTPTSTICRGE